MGVLNNNTARTPHCEFAASPIVPRAQLTNLRTSPSGALSNSPSQVNQTDSILSFWYLKLKSKLIFTQNERAADRRETFQIMLGARTVLLQRHLVERPRVGQDLLINSCYLWVQGTVARESAFQGWTTDLV